MIIKNGIVFCDTNIFQKKDIQIENNIITKIADTIDSESETVVDASDLYVLPGLVDIHSHGAVGYDFSDGNEEGLYNILKYEKSRGITSYCPTSMTLTKKELSNIFNTVKNVKNQSNSSYARLIGINMEGPFLDPQKKGAHVENNIINPDIDFFNKCNNECDGYIKLVTIAPNMPGANKFIEELKETVNISIGHTSANYETTINAFKLGANHVTHLFNAMPAFAHRDPGVIGAAFDAKNVFVELICDGIHVSPSMIRATFELFQNRVVLISDSMRATGLEDGQYTLGGQQVNVKGKLATLKDGTIAGSVTCLYDCMKTAISFGIAPELAIAAATINPANSIKNTHIGSISIGKTADLLLVNKDWDLIKII